MNLWSGLNGNLGKVPEQAAAVDMEKNLVKGPGSDLLVDPTDLGKTPKKPVILTAIAVGVVLVLAFNIIMKMTANDTSDAFTVTAMSNGTAIELYENPLQVNAYKNGEWIYEEAPSVSGQLIEIKDLFPVVVWNETFDIVVPEDATRKWFRLYDENLRYVCQAPEMKEVNETLAELTPDTYFLVAGANWDGKYVLKSFTNETFSSEFVVAVVKE